MNIPEEKYKRPMGRRFELEVDERLEEILSVYEASIQPNPDDSKQVAAEKAEKLKRMLNYRAFVNPKTTYNAPRKNIINFRARRLTVEKLDDFLYAIGWTPKYFLEVCLAENRGFTVDQCLNYQENFHWAKITWPDVTFQRMAEALDAMDHETREAMANLIKAELPKSFPKFTDVLNSLSAEYGKNDKNLPAYLRENMESYVPEKKRENMGDRILETIKYLYNDDETVGKLCDKAKISFDNGRSYKTRHYWLFKPKDFKRLCTVFKITPHWAFYGDREIALLAQNAETETIMDLFQFLDEEMKETVMLTAEKIVAVKGAEV